MITDDDIRRVVPQRSFAAGVRYHLDGRVTEADTELMLLRHNILIILFRFLSIFSNRNYQSAIALRLIDLGMILPSGICQPHVLGVD
ncbi:MAG: hypothetical protein ACRYG8_14935 [Janthinobacterium lividum]